MRYRSLQRRLRAHYKRASPEYGQLRHPNQQLGLHAHLSRAQSDCRALQVCELWPQRRRRFARGRAAHWRAVYPRYALIHGNSIGAPSGTGNGAIASDFGAFGCVISNNTFEAGAGGISLQGYNASPTDGNIPPSDCIITGNVIESISNAFVNGIKVTASVEAGAPSGNVAARITITNNVLRGSLASAIKLVDVQEALIAGNMIAGWNASSSALSVTGGGASNVTNASDTFAVLLTAGAPATSTGCQFITVTGNDIHSLNTFQLGVYCELAGAFQNIVSNNQFVQSSSAMQLYVTPSSTRTLFRGNISEAAWRAALYKGFPALAATTTVMTNNTNGDLIAYISGGTVTAINYDGSATGLTSGAIKWPQQTTISVTYSAAPAFNLFYDAV